MGVTLYLLFEKGREWTDSGSLIRISGMRVYLDNCVYNRPFDDQGQIRISLEAQAKLYIQQCIKNNKLDLVCSYVSVYENSENPNQEHRKSIQVFFNNAIEYVDVDKAHIVESRAEIIKKYGIKSNDALHLSCAIEGKCGYFITTDEGILKKYPSTDIRVCNPIDFLVEVKNA